MMVFLDAFVFNKPEIFVGAAQTKFDDKTGELKDEATPLSSSSSSEGFEIHRAP